MVSGRYLPWEENAFARVKWFMHPFIADTCIRTHIVYEVGVRPGERTGLLRHQGNSFCYVLEGEGTTTIDGVEWPWRAGDMIQLPARPPGITLRHSVEPGAPSEARLICFELNTVDQVGIDRGCGYDLLEPAELKG